MFSHNNELSYALEQLDALRKSLDYLRSTTDRSELAESFLNFQGRAATGRA